MSYFGLFQMNAKCKIIEYLEYIFIYSHHDMNYFESVLIKVKKMIFTMNRSW